MEQKKSNLVWFFVIWAECRKICTASRPVGEGGPAIIEMGCFARVEQTGRLLNK